MKSKDKHLYCSHTESKTVNMKQTMVNVLGLYAPTYICEPYAIMLGQYGPV